MNVPFVILHSAPEEAALHGTGVLLVVVQVVRQVPIMGIAELS